MKSTNRANTPHFEGNQFSTFLGDCDYDGQVYDLYFDPQIPGIPTVIARFSNEPADYASGLGFALKADVNGEVDHPLYIAMNRAIEDGLLKVEPRYAGLEKDSDELTQNVLVEKADEVDRAEFEGRCEENTVRQYWTVNDEHARLHFREDGVDVDYLKDVARQAREERQKQARARHANNGASMSM